jgi:hypothetical protein
MPTGEHKYACYGGKALDHADRPLLDAHLATSSSPVKPEFLVELGPAAALFQRKPAGCPLSQTAPRST